MNEQLYDDEIAPALLALARKCEAAGMTFVARVEWEKGEGGSTVVGDVENSGPAQLMTALAARCNGNFDALAFGLIKRLDVSASIFLHGHNQHKAESKP